MDLFDLTIGQLKKDAGMGLAASNRESLLEFAQAKAVELASQRIDRTVSADDVYMALSAAGVSMSALGPAAGSIFRGEKWEFTGEWIKSTRVSNHARMIRVWRLRARAI